ncbi:hypothetical protein HYZ78_00595 [Candidatus Microgenomates bacterium]|nr:hypothetical protein [Candidatus Microgenomates bacterium]
MGNKVFLTFEQKKATSLFFNNVAAGWFISGIIVPSITNEFSPLITLKVLANITVAMYLSLTILKEEL